MTPFHVLEDSDDGARILRHLLTKGNALVREMKRAEHALNESHRIAVQTAIAQQKLVLVGLESQLGHLDSPERARTAQRNNVLRGRDANIPPAEDTLRTEKSPSPCGLSVTDRMSRLDSADDSLLIVDEDPFFPTASAADSAASDTVTTGDSEADTDDALEIARLAKQKARTIASRAGKAEQRRLLAGLNIVLAALVKASKSKGKDRDIRFWAAAKAAERHGNLTMRSLAPYRIPGTRCVWHRLEEGFFKNLPYAWSTEIVVPHLKSCFDKVRGKGSWEQYDPVKDLLDAVPRINKAVRADMTELEDLLRRARETRPSESRDKWAGDNGYKRKVGVKYPDIPWVKGSIKDCDIGDDEEAEEEEDEDEDVLDMDMD